jgi:hypothetical protein
METKLLDSAHGWAGDDKYVLEQYWSVQYRDEDGDVEDEDVLRITIQHHQHEANKRLSTAELLCLTGEETGNQGEFAIRLRAFPSQWWMRLDIEADGGVEPPAWLEEVADNLLRRFVVFCERINDSEED